MYLQPLTLSFFIAMLASAAPTPHSTQQTISDCASEVHTLPILDPKALPSQPRGHHETRGYTSHDEKRERIQNIRRRIVPNSESVVLPEKRDGGDEKEQGGTTGGEEKREDVRQSNVVKRQEGWGPPRRPRENRGCCGCGGGECKMPLLYSSYSSFANRSSLVEAEIVVDVNMS